MVRSTILQSSEEEDLGLKIVPSRSGMRRQDHPKDHRRYPWRLCPADGKTIIQVGQGAPNMNHLTLAVCWEYDKSCLKKYPCEFDIYPRAAFPVTALLKVINYERVVGHRDRIFYRHDAIGRDTRGSLVFYQGSGEVDTNAGVIICPVGTKVSEEEIRTFILVKDPRLEFIRWLRSIIPRRQGIHPTAIVESCVSVGERVYIGPLSVIGRQGFGYGREEDGSLLHFPHIGGVRIGDDVDICTGVIIDRGALDDTVIEDGSKLNNACMVGHNAHIGKRCIIGAHASIHGGSVLEDDVYVAPGVRVGKVRIGQGSTLGWQSVVMEDIPENSIAYGIPARVRK